MEATYKLTKAQADAGMIPMSTEGTFQVYLTDGANGNGPGFYLKQSDGTYIFIGDGLAAKGGTINGSLAVVGDISQTALGAGDVATKLGFHGVATVARATTAVAEAAFVANGSGITDDSATFGGYKIGQVVKALQLVGILT